METTEDDTLTCITDNMLQSTRKLSNLVMIDLKDFVDASAADLDTDEALAVYLDCAPLFDAYMREIAFMAEYHVRLAAAACRENVRAAALLEVIR